MERRHLLRWYGLLTVCALLLSAGQASAYDWDRWMYDLWTTMPVLRATRLGMDNTVNQLNGAVRAGLATGTYPDALYDPAQAELKDGKLLISGKPVTFASAGKDLKGLKGLIACRWSFKLAAADNLYLFFNNCPVAVFLNGERLYCGTRKYWGALSRGGQTAPGLAGENVMYAVFREPGRFEANPMLFPEGYLRKPPADVVSQLRSVPSKEGTAMLATVLWEYSEWPMADPQKIAAAFIVWAQSCDSIVRRDPAAPHVKEFSEAVQHALYAGWQDSPGRLVSAMERELPAWALESIFFREGRFHQDAALQVARAWMQRRELEKVQEYCIRWQGMIEKRKGEREDWSRYVRVLRDLSSDCADYSDYGLGGLLAKRGLEVYADKLKKSDKDETIKWFSAIISRMTWQARTASGDLASPEAEQYYTQIDDLLKAGAVPDQAAVQRIYSTYVANGGLLLAQGTTVLSLRKALELRMQQSTLALETVRKYAAQRIGEDSSDMQARNDLPALEKAANELSGLIGTENLRQTLLREYVDRGELSLARQQALILAGSRLKGVRTTAYAYLLYIENRLGINPEDRARVPADLLAAKTSFQGGLATLEQLAQNFFPGMAQAGKVRKGSAPGQVTGFLPLEAGLAPAAWGDQRNYNDARNPQTQPAEPMLLGGAVVAGDLSGVCSTAPDGKLRWRYQYPGVVGGLNGPDNAGSLPVVSDGESLLALAPAMYGAGANLLAFSYDGRVKWQSKDAPKVGTWSVCGAPYAAFGRLYSLVADTSSADNYVLGVACLSPLNGAIINPVPLITMPRSFRMQNFLTGQHFTAGEKGVYGWTGNGGIFGINRDTGYIEWLTSLPVKNERFRGGPAGFCSLVGGKLLAYVPEAAELVMLEPESGRVIWRRMLPDLVAVHSRDYDGGIIISLAAPWGDRRVLLALDPKTGDPLWQVNASALILGGEGTVSDGIVYLPVTGGAAAFQAANGAFVKALPAEAKLLKLRQDHDLWYASTAEGVYMLSSAGTFGGFTPPPVDVPPVRPADKIPANQAPLDQNLNLEWELPAYRIDKGDLHVREVPGHPHHFILINDEYVTLASEGYYSEAGVYQPPRVEWNSYLPNRKFSGAYMAENTEWQVRVYSILPRKLVFSFAPQSGADGVFGAFRIKGAFLGDASVVIRLDSGQILVGDLKTGNITQTSLTLAKDDDWLLFNGRYLVSGRWDRAASCYDMNSGGKKVWERKEQCFNRVLIDKDNILLQTKSKLELIRLDTGQGTPIPGGGLERDPGRAVRVGNYASVGGKLLNLKDHKFESGIGSAASDLYGKALLVMDNFDKNNERKVYLVNGQKMIELEGVPDEVKRNRWRNGEVSVGVYGDKAFVFFIEWLNIYSLKDGKLLSTRRLCPDYNGRAAFLGRSMMTSNPSDNFIYLFGLTKPVSGCTQVSAALQSGGEWPRRGWTAPVSLDAKYWQGGELPEGFSLRQGSDGAYGYLELTAPEQFGEDEFRLGLSLSDENKRHLMDFDLNLNEAAASGQEGQATTPAAGVDVNALQQDGRRQFRIRIKLPANDNSSGSVLPDYALRLDRLRYGVLQGSFVYGTACLNNFTRFITPPEDWVDCQNQDNYAAREKLYSEVNSFFPQGTELLNWLRTRRVMRGSEDNLRFLGQMAARAANAPCVANILSAMLMEKVELFAQQNPQMDRCSPEFIQKIPAFAQELRAFADGLKIPDGYSSVGLSGFMIVAYDGMVETNPMEWVKIYRSGKNRQEYTFFLRRNSPFVGTRGARTLVLLPLGAAQGMDLISEMDGLGFARGCFGEVNFFRPGNLQPLLLPDGKFGKDVSLLSVRGRESKDWQKVEDFSFRPYDAAKGLFYRGTDNNGRIKFASIKLPDAPKDQPKLSENDILLALKNLPSDSQLGLSLVDAYGAVTEGKGKVSTSELYRMILQRVSLRDWEQRDIVNRLRWVFTQEAQAAAQKRKDAAAAAAAGKPVDENEVPEESVDVKLARFLQDAGMTRGTIRLMMSDDHNLVSKSNVWRVLTQPAEEMSEFAPSPMPDDADDPVEQIFTAKEKEYRFVTDVDLDRTFWGIKDTLTEESTVWLLAKVRSDRDQKFFLYLTQRAQGGGWNAKGKALEVTGWLNREKFLDTQTLPMRDKGLLSVSGQLQEGENMLLLKLSFSNRWMLGLSLGDSFGAPLPGVEVEPWPDAKGTDGKTEPKKPVKLKPKDTSEKSSNTKKQPNGAP